MAEDAVIEPMTADGLLWRCLHGGPVSRDLIGQRPPDNRLPWERYQRRNVPLLRKLTATYGACAFLARAGDEIVGHLRFYPKAVGEMNGAGFLCLQQDHPYGPADGFVDDVFPDLSRIEDKTLVVHCLMTGSPQRKENPFLRKGIGTRLAGALIQWAKANGWAGIEAESFEDVPLIYEITGSAGHTFWEKLGFRVADRGPHPHLRDRNEFVLKLEAQAEALGIPPERARDRLLMRLDLD